MKFKYKKMIVIISMCTMFIGFITLYVGVPSAKKSARADNEQNVIAQQPQQTSEDTIWQGSKQIEVNAYEEINQLIKDYLNARVNCEEEKLKGLISGTSSLDVVELQKKAEHVEGYQNIECYTLKSPTEGIYVVYVYEELKIMGIDTLAPGMIRLLVSLAEDGKPYVYFGPIDDGTLKFMKETEQSEEVKALIEKVNLKLEEAISGDSQLKEFNERLKNAAKVADEKAKVSEDTAVTEEPSQSPAAE